MGTAAGWVSAVRSGLACLLLALLLAAGCAPTGPGQSGQPASAPREQRTLQSIIRVEPVSLASKPLQSTGISIRHATRLFNAELDIYDSHDNPVPYLAEALPRLNSESWKVFPDGRMETTYHLKPNLAWQDGTLLSAEDFVFATRVYRTPELGVSLLGDRVQEVAAPDERTLVIRWRTIYPDAGVLGVTFQALPRHLLAQDFAQAQTQPDAFISQSFWSTAYVGLGPFRLVRWEPGASIEGVAFDQHVWGRPKIDRVSLRFLADENSVMATLLARGVDFATDRTIRFEHGMTLRREWGANNGGTVILTPSQARYILVQFRPEVVIPPAMLDLRVRQALAHTIDRQALNDALFDGQGVPSETFVRPNVPYYAELQRAIAHYPLDPRQAQQRMEESGFRKDSAGFFVNASGERFSPLFWDETGAHNEDELAILADTWKRAGFDMQTYMLPAAQLPNAQVRSSFPAMYTTTGAGVTENGLEAFTIAQTPRPDNRYSGMNRGAWVSPEYDRLWEGFVSTLDRAERNQNVMQMEKLVSEQLPSFMLFFNFGVSAHVAALRGPDPTAIDSDVNWNIQEWELS